MQKKVGCGKDASRQYELNDQIKEYQGQPNKREQSLSAGQIFGDEIEKFRH